MFYPEFLFVWFFTPVSKYNMLASSWSPKIAVLHRKCFFLALLDEYIHACIYTCSFDRCLCLLCTKQSSAKRSTWAQLVNCRWLHICFWELESLSGMNDKGNGDLCFKHMYACGSQEELQRNTVAIIYSYTSSRPVYRKWSNRQDHIIHRHLRRHWEIMKYTV